MRNGRNGVRKHQQTGVTVRVWTEGKLLANLNGKKASFMQRGSFEGRGRSFVANVSYTYGT